MAFALIVTAVLLAVAVAVVRRVPLLGQLFIPASVVAGTFGFFTVFASEVWVTGQWPWKTDGQTGLLADTVTHWRSWPGFLIAVVFAGMLLQRSPSSATNSIQRAGREGLMVWIIVLGQTAIGLLVTWLIVQPMNQVPDAFGMLIETGFAGGHGTAAAMGQVFASDQVQLEGGLDLGIMMATVGLVYGILSGVFWVNVGVRKGWTRAATRNPVLPSHGASDVPESGMSLGTAVVKPDVIDPLLLQAIWLLLAFGIGWMLQLGVQLLVGQAEWLLRSDSVSDTGSLANKTQLTAIVGSFPLFIYTLFGGWIVRRLLVLMKADHLVDAMTVGRITSASMDLLVVAAIASLNLEVVSGRLAGLIVLVVAGAIWTAFCLVYLSRRILPAEHWFELGLINYGMSTGTTATGFVLLKLVDPELESGAAEDYALAAPISSPFVGGGMVTIGLPMLVLGTVPLSVIVAVLTAIVVALVFLGFRLSK